MVGMVESKRKSHSSPECTMRAHKHGRSLIIGLRARTPCASCAPLPPPPPPLFRSVFCSVCSDAGSKTLSLSFSFFPSLVEGARFLACQSSAPSLPTKLQHRQQCPASTPPAFRCTGSKSQKNCSRLELLPERAGVGMVPPVYASLSHSLHQSAKHQPMIAQAPANHSQLESDEGYLAQTAGKANAG